MQNLIKLAIGLTLAASTLNAQSGPSKAPVPGPYMIVIAPQRITPQRFIRQQFTMPMPYWMQNSQAQRQQPAAAQAPTQSPPAVGRASQQPSSTGWQPAPVAPNTQGNSTGPTPGFFPSYNSGLPQQTARQQPAAPSNGAPYPSNNFAPMPWGQNRGQQGFRPMPAPWQYGGQYGGQQYGQNGWGNNWNNNGYGNGYPQGYPAPNPARQ